VDKFAAYRAYVTVVEEAGFAAAARALGQSRSAVNRQIIALEDALGVQLLNRTTRQVSPTAGGEAFYHRAKTILAALAEAESEVALSHDEVRGQLRINAPMSFGTLHLGPALADFMKLHPALRLELHLNDRIVDIIEEGYDLAIRIATPQEDTTLVDFRICTIRRVVCATPDYLAVHGRPAHPKALKNHACLHYGNMPSGTLWRFRGPQGDTAVQIRPFFLSNNGEALRAATLAGLGISLLPTFIVGADLQNGQLVTLLDDYAVPDVTLSAVYPPTRHLTAKIRLLTDFLIARFGTRPHWDLVT
jgi:DNA-binding transcriptional LysR family regulator